MALSHGATPIVTDGLVLCLDAGNSAKGYDLKQNYFPNSEDITLQTGGWTATGSGFDYGGTGTIPITTANYGIAPDGTQTADRIQLDKGSGTTSDDRSGIRYNLSMVNRTLSYYVKFLDSTTIEQFTTSVYPQDPTWTYDTLSDGWYRVKCTESTSATVRIQYLGTSALKNSLDALVWGIQLEDGSVATDYVKTTGTAKQKQWFNLSGDFAAGTFYGSPIFNTNNKGYFTFDGTEDYFDFYAPGLTTVATVEMWVRLGVDYNNNMLMGWLNYDIQCRDSGIAFNTGNGDAYGISSTVVNQLGLVGNWAHYVFEMRSDVSYTNNKMYINTNQQTLSQLVGVELPERRIFNDGNGRIATWKGTTSTAYLMDMDCAVFKVYNRALTQTEISQNFNALRGRYGI